jgi:hypothetical protein
MPKVNGTASDAPAPLAPLVAPAAPFGYYHQTQWNTPAALTSPAGPAEGAACNVPCNVGPAPCGPPGNCWVSVEYLLWWIKNDNLPPLVTTGPAQFPVGFLGQPGTVILLGNSSLDHGDFSGARVTAGTWLDCNHTCGVEVSGFFLGKRTVREDFNNSVLARPFFNVNQGIPFSEFAAFPGISTGRISFTSPSELNGAEANWLHNLCCECNYRVDMTGGVRYLDLREAVNIVESATFAATAPFPGLAGNSFVATDRFATRNQFYGGQGGIKAQYWRDRWRVDLKAEVALGETHEVIDVQGSQLATTPTGTRLATGGLLALPSNIGHFTRNEFAVVPEVGVNLGYRFTDHLTALVGYNFLYWSKVARPGDQIDVGLDVTQIPNFGVTAPAAGQVRPALPFKTTDFWAQGVSVGLELRW